MTVGDILTRMSSLELTHWVEEYALDPWGEERADLRSAIVARSWAGGRIKDYMPRFGEDDESWKDQKRRMIMGAAEARLRRRKHQRKDGIKHAGESESPTDDRQFPDGQGADGR